MALNFASFCRTIAVAFWGEPNMALSKPRQLRWGTHGSRSLDLNKGTFFDHEANAGGGMVDLIRRELGEDVDVAEVLERRFGIPRDPRPVRHEHFYDYVDEDGAVPYRVQRIDILTPGQKDAKTFRQWRAAAGGWLPNMTGVTALPYNLPALLAADPKRVVYIVEGEKCADAVIGLGLLATTNHGGATKWWPSLNRWFEGRRVVIIPDQDDAGERHLHAVAAALTDVAASIRVLRLPDGGPKYDVADWIQHGGEQEQLIAMTKAAEVYSPPPGVKDEEGLEGLDLGEPPPPPKPEREPLKILPYSEFSRLPPVEWLVDTVLPARSKTVLFGVSNAFKSFLAIDLACSVATGRSWHDHPVKQGPVLYIATEGAFGVGRKRIPAWMARHEIPLADRENVRMVTGDVLLSGDMSLVVTDILEAFGRAPALIVVDVLAGTMDGSESDDEAARDWVHAATQLVLELETALLVVTHSPYSEEGRMRGHSHMWGSFDTRLKAEGDKESKTTTLTVNRHKDHDSAGTWSFQLEEQAPDEHPLETSLVPVLHDAAATRKAEGPRLPPSMQPVWDALVDAIGESGTTPPGHAQIPAGVKAIRVSLWRQSYYTRSSHEPETKKKTFKRTLDRLEARGTIGGHADWVWITGT